MIHDISVIIPMKSLEELDYLQRILEQLCRQVLVYRLDIIVITLPDIERPAVQAVQNLKTKFEYIPPIHIASDVEMTSVINARNSGAMMAEGDIIVFLDVDTSFEDNKFAIALLTEPIINQEYMMTYSPVEYDISEGKTKKEQKLIKYNNFLRRFDVFPRVPFAISKEALRKVGYLKEKHTYFLLYIWVLQSYPGGIEKIGIKSLMSPRHILEESRKRYAKHSNSRL